MAMDTVTEPTTPTPWQPPGEYTVVLFYRYVAIDDVDALCASLRAQCTTLGLLGRVLVASEGVNGTLAGAPACIEAFTTWMVTTDAARFRLIDWKTSTGRGAELPFLSLSIRATAELVSVGGPQRALLAARAPFDPASFGGLANTGTHLSPQDFHAALSAQQGRSAASASASASAPPPLLVDVRNQFEYDIGHFDHAAPLNCATYAESWAALDTLLHGKDPASTPVYMYCTGGIRCEKASVYVKARGFHEVYQLEGGIHRYLEAFPDGGLFKGKNFVFDARVAVPPAGDGDGENKEGEAARENDDADKDEDDEEDGGAEEEVVGQCLDCRRPHDTFSGRVVCTVCRLPVLVCPACRDDPAVCQPGEYHCWRHRHLKHLYFTVLDRFTPAQLITQREGLLRLEAAMTRTPASKKAAAMAAKETAASGETAAAVLAIPADRQASKKCRNKRATLRKQRRRIEERLAILGEQPSHATRVDVEEETSGSGADTPSGEAVGRSNQPVVPPLVPLDDPLGNPKTRLGWGFWRS